MAKYKDISAQESTRDAVDGAAAKDFNPWAYLVDSHLGLGVADGVVAFVLVLAVAAVVLDVIVNVVVLGAVAVTVGLLELLLACTCNENEMTDRKSRYIPYLACCAALHRIFCPAIALFSHAVNFQGSNRTYLLCVD